MVSLHRIDDRDGRPYRLRPIEPADAPALQRAFEQMDRTDRYTRLFAPTRELTDAVALGFCTIVSARDMCLVLEAADVPGELLGGCRLMGDRQGTGAEFSVSLRTDMKGRGLGRRLMQVLLVEVETRGFTEIWGSSLVENGAMLALCRKLGFRLARDPEDPALVRATWTPPAANVSTSARGDETDPDHHR